MCMKTTTFALIAVMGFACVGASAQTSSTTPDGYVMRNQQIYVIRNGQATPLEGEVTMRITPEGQITGFDGQSRQLSESVMLTVDGRVLPVPPGTVFPAAPSAPAVIDRFADRRAQLQNDSGENRSGLAAPASASSTQSSSATGSSGAMTNGNTGTLGGVEGSQVPLSSGNNNGGGSNAFPLYNNGVTPVVTDQVIPGSASSANANPNNSTLQSNVPVVDPLTGQATIQGNMPVNNAAGSTNESSANPNSGNQINDNANGGTGNNLNPNQGQPVPSAGMNNNNQGNQNQNQNQQDQNSSSDTNNNANRSQGPEDRPNSSNATSPNRNSNNNDSQGTTGSQSQGGSNSNSSGNSGAGSSSGSGSSSSGGGGSGASSGGVTQ